MELLPVIFLTCILPFTMRMDLVETSLGQLSFLPESMGLRADFFLLWKSRLLIITAVIMCIILLDRFLIRGKRDRKWKQWIPLLVYEGFVLLSTFLSEYRFYSIHGMPEHFESLWVLLSYAVVAYYTYLVIETKEQVQLLMKCLTASAFLQGVAGVFQVAGLDLWATDFMKNLMVPGEYSHLKDRIVFGFSDEAYQKVSTSLYSTNYAGVYFAMLLFPVLFYFLSEKAKNKIFPGITTVLLFISLMGTGSKSAMGCVFFLLAVVAIGWGWLEKKRRYAGILILFVFGIFWLGYDGVTGSDTLGRFMSNLQMQEKEYPLSSISVEADRVKICYKGETLYMQYRLPDGEHYVTVEDEKGNPLEMVTDASGAKMSPADERFSELVFSGYYEGEIPYMQMEYGDIAWKFTDATDSGQLRYINIWDKVDEIEQAESWLFDGKEELFTYRGYIWSRTLPLLKEYWLTGSGPDTFLFVFPQRDYVMRANMGYGFFSEILTKPHSMYLQMAVQTGIFSLVAWLVWCAVFAAGFIRWLKEKKDGMGIGLFLGVSAYLLLGIFNDSMVVTAPVFFVLYGVGKKYIQIEKM